MRYVIGNIIGIIRFIYQYCGFLGLGGIYLGLISIISGDTSGGIAFIVNGIFFIVIRYSVGYAYSAFLGMIKWFSDRNKGTFLF